MTPPALATTSSAPAPLLARLGRHRGLIFPIACIALLAVLLVPLPPGLVDLLLVVNLTVSVLLLVTAMYVRSPLEFAVLPSLLLAVTLFRLTLNVATTRLILTAGSGNVPPQQALDDAGHVVLAFAQFVTSGSLAVGMILFAIIFIIQFVVITKGAGRISEVAARFTLDAMPGKQMAVDADLNAGIIDRDQARARREEIAQQADFYGAMDGASKFIRGDAIAGLLITLVNIGGGMYVGKFERGWPLGATAELFTTLTIGDGLVAQVPAFITALGCALLVTRSSAKAELGEQVAAQLFSSPLPLWIAAGFLLCLSVTGLPFLPLIVLAAGCAGMAYMLGRKPPAAQMAEEPSVAAGDSFAPEQPPAPLETLLDIEVLELELGCGLAHLADQNKGGDLLTRISAVRREVAAELGLIIPAVRVRDSALLLANDYVIRIRGTIIARGEAYQDQFLARKQARSVGPIPHATAVADPAGGGHAYWITASQLTEAHRLGYVVLPAGGVIAVHLAAVVRQHGHLLLSRQEVHRLVEHLRQRSPALIEQVVGPQVKLGELQKVLQGLLRRGACIRDLERIIETLADEIHQTQDMDRLTQLCMAATVGPDADGIGESRRSLESCQPVP